ncbi:MAG: sigma-70 family RNA polymerase sigma factor [Kiritimatiellia bacterium]|jgi:RNA polymerase sigma-70 factor (ECF subfamily)
MVEINEDWSRAEQVRAGDDRAFDALMARYKRPVLNFVYRLIGDAGEAEDVAQGVFVRAYQAIRKPGFRRTTGAFSTWLFQVARNAAIDWLRRRKRHPESQAILGEDGGNEAVTARTADSEMTAKEIGEQIAAVVARLPADQKTAVILSEYENRSYAEIAAIMQCSLKSVESRLYRAKRFLRDRLRDLRQFPP